MARPKYAVRTITCPTCSTTVTKRMPERTKYCSHSCYLGRTREKSGTTITCEQCGKTAYRPPARMNVKAHFCSLPCQITWQGRNKTHHTCTICGNHFRWSPSRERVSNIKYCSIKCRDADPEKIAQLREMNVAQQKGGRTRLESAGYKLLDDLRVSYLPQHLIAGKFCVDAFLPDLNTVVQFDGDYWHGNPERFPTLDARQERRRKLDSSQDAYMRRLGYQVVRIWESDMNKSTGEVKRVLASAIRTAKKSCPQRTSLPEPEAGQP